MESMNKYIYIICVALMLLLSNCRNVDKNFLPVEDNYFLQHISLGMTQKEYAKYAVDSVKINGYCFEVRPGFENKRLSCLCLYYKVSEVLRKHKKGEPLKEIHLLDNKQLDQVLEMFENKFGNADDYTLVEKPVERNRCNIAEWYSKFQHLYFLIYDPDYVGEDRNGNQVYMRRCVLVFEKRLEKDTNKDFLPMEDNYFLQHITLGMPQEKYAKYAVDSVNINGCWFEVQPDFKDKQLSSLLLSYTFVVPKSNNGGKQLKRRNMLENKQFDQILEMFEKKIGNVSDYKSFNKTVEREKFTDERLRSRTQQLYLVVCQPGFDNIDKKYIQSGSCTLLFLKRDTE